MTQLSKQHRQVLNAMGIDIWRKRGSHADALTHHETEPMPAENIEPMSPPDLTSIEHPEVESTGMSIPNASSLCWIARDYRTLIIVIVKELSSESGVLTALADDVARAYNGVEMKAGTLTDVSGVNSDVLQSLADPLQRSSARVALLLIDEALEHHQPEDLLSFLRGQTEQKEEGVTGRRHWIHCNLSSLAERQLLMKRRLWMELNQVGR